MLNIIITIIHNLTLKSNYLSVNKQKWLRVLLYLNELIISTGGEKDDDATKIKI